MRKTYFFKGFFTPLLLLSSQFAMTDAGATSQIMGNAVSKGIKVTSCQSCHNSTPGNEDKNNLKPNYLTAYKLDKSGLSRLKNLINGCPAGTTLNMTTFLCEKKISQSGTVGSATSGAAKTDVYSVTCGTGSAYLTVSVIDLAPVKPPLVSVQATKSTAASTLSTDTVDGDAKYSPVVKLAKGAGIYTMKVNKSASTTIGAESYTAEFYCRDSAGAQTSTVWKLMQNQ